MILPYFGFSSFFDCILLLYGLKLTFQFLF